MFKEGFSFVFGLASDGVAGVIEHYGTTIHRGDEDKGVVLIESGDGDLPGREGVFADSENGETRAFLVD